MHTLITHALLLQMPVFLWTAEHQRQAVDETHQIDAAVVAGCAQLDDLEFTHRQKRLLYF